MGFNSVFKGLNPRPQHTAEGMHRAVQNKGPVDLYRLETELGSVAENTKKLQKYFIFFCRIIAGLSQNAEFLFDQFSDCLDHLLSACV